MNLQDLSLVMLTFITWIREYLPSLSIVRLLVYSSHTQLFGSESLNLAHPV